MTKKQSKLTILPLFLTCLIACGCSKHLAPAAQIRNVLFISADDHAAYAVGVYGNRIVRTPNLDRLASQGTLFERAFTNSPLCTPSRQSTITGRYPYATGVTLLRTALGEEQITIADHLRQFGFKTAAIGKIHFNSKLKHGFDHRLDSKDHLEHLQQNHHGLPPTACRSNRSGGRFRDPAQIWLNAKALPGDQFGLHTADPVPEELRAYYDEDAMGTYLPVEPSSFYDRIRRKGPTSD